MGVDWIIAEYDKLNRLVEATTKSASEAMESLTSGDFEFDESVAEETPEVIDSGANEVEDAPLLSFFIRCFWMLLICGHLICILNLTSINTECVFVLTVS